MNTCKFEGWEATQLLGLQFSSVECSDLRSFFASVASAGSVSVTVGILACRRGFCQKLQDFALSYGYVDVCIFCRRNQSRGFHYDIHC